MAQLLFDLLLVVWTMAVLTEATFPGSVTESDPLGPLKT